MLLTISTAHQPAGDLGWLAHKHPDKFQTFDLSFGQVHVFFPEVSETRCTLALMLDVDPVNLVRGGGPEQSGPLDQYVNDRPYVASSLMSVAISQVLGTALGGRSKDRPELAATPLPFTARLDVLPVRGGPQILHRLFEPLGYTVTAERYPLDEQFPEWGTSPYYSVTIAGTQTLSRLLTHLYVLIPVFDNQKHYYIGDDEVEKLLQKGEGWLAAHPEREFITRRYLKNRGGLVRQAIRILSEGEAAGEQELVTPQQEDSLESTLSLNQQRYQTVIAALRESGTKTVLDLGCAEGKLIAELLQEKQLERIVGLDVSLRTLEVAAARLDLERLQEQRPGRVELWHGSLMYRDRRLENFDAALVVEVIEHLDPPRLAAMQRALFQFARPRTVILTTPNVEYNVRFPTLPAGQFRHGDHRFEWTRREFQDWANQVATAFGYSIRFAPVGPVDEDVGSPTQMAVFTRE